MSDEHKAIKVTRVEVSDEVRRGLQTNARAIPGLNEARRLDLTRCRCGLDTPLPTAGLCRSCANREITALQHVLAEARYVVSRVKIGYVAELAEAIEAYDALVAPAPARAETEHTL